MWNWIGALAIGVGAVGLAAFTALLVTIRTGFTPGLTAIRRINRRFTNPRVLKAAGQKGESASVIRHVGRSSGASYRTPVGVVTAANEFIIALPYGTTADWVRNVVAAGTAVLDTDGQSYSVAEPRVLPAADVAGHLSAKDRLVNRVFGLDQFLVLSRG